MRPNPQNPMTRTKAYADRLPAASGNRDNDYWQATCDACLWRHRALYSNRTVEGRRLAEMAAADHNTTKHTGDTHE